MAYVVTGGCMGERFGACVEACPVDAFRHGEHDGAPMMVIDSEACICCGACLPECPIDAIVDDESLAPEWAEYNAAAARLWPVALPDDPTWQRDDTADA